MACATTCFGVAMDVKLLEEAASTGGAEAQYALGTALLTSQEPGDLARALELLRGAARQHHAAAMCNLGVAYAEGRGVERDLTTARSFYERAVEQGDKDSCYNLALLYAEGPG